MASRNIVPLLRQSALATAAWLAVGTLTAQAQGQLSPVPAQAIQGWSIPAGPLADTLLQIGLQGGQSISVAPEAVRGQVSPAIQGRLTVRQAAQAALSGSTLELVSTANGTLSVRPRADGLPLAPAATLEEVRVLARAEPETALSPVAGFAARVGRFGTKTDTPLIETPQSISVVTRDEMDSRGVQTVTEALRYVPGVAIETYGPDSKGYDWLMIRGFNGQATSDYRDGLRQASNSYALFRTEPYGMERIDILRGPSSALYGQSEAGGVIDRTTKRPTGDRLREVQVGHGTGTVKQAGFDLSDTFGVDGALAWRLTGFVREGQDVFGDQNDRIYLAPSLNVKISPDTRITFLADYLRDRVGLAHAWSWTYPGNPPTPTRIRYSEIGFDRFHQNQASVGWQLEHRFNDSWSFRQNARAGTVDVPLFNKTMLNGLQADGRTLTRYAFRREESLDQLTLDNQFTGRLALGRTQHVLLAGVDLSRVKADARRWIGAEPSLDLQAPVYDQNFTLPTTLQMDSRIEQQQVGLYAQDQIRFAERWIATLGGRYDEARTSTDSRITGSSQVQRDHAFTGRAGLSYQLPTGVAPYVSYATSFLPLIGTNTSTGSPFEPTEGKQFEVGVKYQPPGSASLYTAALFDLRKTNTSTSDPLTGLVRQVGETRSRGLELEAKTELRRGWNLTASYTRHDVEVTRSDIAGELAKRPALVPENLASAWTDVQLGAGIGAGIGVRYVGKTYGDAANTLAVAGRTLVDAALHYDIEHWRFALNINNLLDKQYLSTCATTACYWGAPRNALLTARYRW